MLIRGHVWSSGDRVFESTLGEGDRVSLRETTLEEETGGVWGRQTLEARGRGPLRGLPPRGAPSGPIAPGLQGLSPPNSPCLLLQGCLSQTHPVPLTKA